jgi:pectinesterase
MTFPLPRLTGFTSAHLRLARALVCVAACALACGAHARAQRDLRPQLSADQAKQFSMDEVLKYVGPAGLERVDPWQPMADPLAQGAPFKPDYIVDARAKPNGRTLFATVQGAIDRAISEPHARRRVYIELKPGAYDGLVIVPPATVAITLYSNAADASRTRLRANVDASTTGAEYAARYGKQFANSPPAVVAMFAATAAKAPIIDTISSPTLWVRNDGFQARNITVENYYNEDPSKPDCIDPACAATRNPAQIARRSHQAVAMMVEAADKVQFENVRFIGHQDTLFLRSVAPGITVRSFFHKVYVEGDVDFIFGDTIAYFYRSEVRTLGARSDKAFAVAPNTAYRARYGFVFDDCDFTNDGSPNALSSRFYLARQWFHRQKCTPYGPLDGVPDYQCTLGSVDAYKEPRGSVSQTVLETVGKVVIMNSRIGNHVRREQPWSEWNRIGTRSHRPAQFDSDEYWANLARIGIDPVKQFGYAPQPREPFLAEFNNTYVTVPAPK